MPSIRRAAQAGLPTSHGDFGMFVYQATDSKEHVALTTGFEPGTVGEDEAILVRLHSECLLRWEHTVTSFEEVLKTVAETRKSGRR